jgi:hypothetical protein
MYRAICFEYETADAAKEVIDRAYAELSNLSAWRTATSDLTRWFVMALLTENTDDSSFDWGGKPTPLSDDQVEWMIHRRGERGLRAVVTGEGEVHDFTSYEPGEEPVVPG